MMLPFRNPIRFVLPVFGLIACVASAQSPSPIQKVGELKLLEPRQGGGIAVTEKAVFVIGGANRTGLRTDVERIDLETNQVTKVFDGLIPRVYAGIAQLGNKVYITGGNDVATGETTLEILDLDTMTVTRGKPMPTARGGFGFTALNGKLYAIGGKRFNGTEIVSTNKVEVYDPATDTWEEGLPMPSPRACTAVTVSGFILVAGGDLRDRALDAVEMYVPEEKIWKKLPPLAARLSYHSTVVNGPYLFLFGHNGSKGQVVAYDLRTRKSSVVETGFKGGRYNVDAAIGPLIFVAGGALSENSFGGDLLQVFGVQELPPK